MIRGEGGILRSPTQRVELYEELEPSASAFLIVVSQRRPPALLQEAVNTMVQMLLLHVRMSARDRRHHFQADCSALRILLWQFAGDHSIGADSDLANLEEEGRMMRPRPLALVLALVPALVPARVRARVVVALAVAVAVAVAEAEAEPILSFASALASARASALASALVLAWRSSPLEASATF